MFSFEADLLAKFLGLLKSSSHYEQNSAAVNELTKQMDDVGGQLESWRKRLDETGALETVVNL